MRLLETVPALFILLASAAVFFGTSGLNYWDGVTPGARFFPAVLSVASVIIGISLLYAQSRGIEQVNLDLPDAAGAVRVGLSILALCGLAFAGPILGFVPMLAVFVLVFLLAILRQKLMPSLLTALIVSGFVYGVFVRWLGVPLPQPIGF